MSHGLAGLVIQISAADFQDRCLEPLGHPSKPTISITWVRRRQNKRERCHPSPLPWALYQVLREPDNAASWPTPSIVKRRERYAASSRLRCARVVESCEGESALWNARLALRWRPRRLGARLWLGLCAKRHEFDGDRVRKMFELRSIVSVNAYSDEPAKYNVSCHAHPAGRSEARADRNVLGLIARFRYCHAELVLASECQCTRCDTGIAHRRAHIRPVRHRQYLNLISRASRDRRAAGAKRGQQHRSQYAHSYPHSPTYYEF